MPPTLIERYRVTAVHAVDGVQLAPPEIAQRFEGRLYTLRELEERGVRIAGRNAWYYANGDDWRLTLALVDG